MKLKPRYLRRLSDLLHNLAMIHFMPLCVARPIAKLSSKLYYTKA